MVLNRCETGTFVHMGVRFLFLLFVPVFPCLVLVWFFLWLPEEELTLLFFLIVRMEISLFL